LETTDDTKVFKLQKFETEVPCGYRCGSQSEHTLFIEIFATIFSQTHQESNTKRSKNLMVCSMVPKENKKVQEKKKMDV